jgi:hypothetical protein
VTFKTIQAVVRKVETAWRPWLQRMDARKTLSRSGQRLSAVLVLSLNGTMTPVTTRNHRMLRNHNHFRAVCGSQRSDE